MKKILFALLLMPFLSVAQDTTRFIDLPRDSATNLVSYKKIVEVPGMSQKEIYSHAREWFAHTFVSANSVLQMDDKDLGKLVGKGNFTYTNVLKVNFAAAAPIVYRVSYTTTVSIKDERYRIVITDFNVGTGNVDGPLENLYSTNNKVFDSMGKKIRIQIKNMYADILSMTDRNAKGLISSLQVSVANKNKDDF